MSFLDEIQYNSIQNGNKWIKYCNISTLLRFTIELPNIQRIRYDEKVDEIVDYQLKYYINEKEFNFLGVINIHYCVENDTIYLVDGQHRFESAKKLYTLAHDVKIGVECVIVQCIDQLIVNYNHINKYTPLPEFPADIDKCIPEKAAEYFFAKYPTIWSTNSRANRPHIFKNYFQEALGVIASHAKTQIINHQSLICIVEDFNTKMSLWETSQYPCPKTITHKMLTKCSESQFYLGLYAHVSDEFRFKWVQKIIEQLTGVVIKSTREKQTKKAIPKHIKVLCWNAAFGVDARTASCPCCEMETIDITHFHAGHIISEKNGGLTVVDNLIPICGQCNLSMGTSDFVTYKTNYHTRTTTKTTPSRSSFFTTSTSKPTPTPSSSFFKARASVLETKNKTSDSFKSIDPFKMFT